jgi:aminoglycoside phosphotransferase (APT) family kinase protein
MVSSWETGVALEGPMPDAVAHDLGELVAQLHQVPSTGYGMLVDTTEEVRGATSDPDEAFTSRWGAGTWPYNGLPLSTHPIVRAAPHLVMPAAALREQLLAYADVPAHAVCHTDLNRSNYLVEDGRLSALIDFGDAAIEPVAFDIASFAFYEGWEAAERFLEGYASNSVLRDIRRAEAQQLSVVLALQKIHKNATRRPDAKRLQDAIAFLEETLPLASRRADA